MKSLYRLNIEKLKNFVISRRVENGFAFCEILPSTLQETYYGVYILKSLNVDIPNKEKIVEFLKSNLKKEVYSIYYAFNSLHLLGEDLSNLPNFVELGDFLLQRLDDALNRINRDLSLESGVTATYSFEMPNVLREVYFVANSLSLLKKDTSKAKKFVKKFRKNGGFGTKSANIKETYYCVSVLGKDNKNEKDVVSFIKQHECKIGGFTKIPNGYPPYLEETFYALQCFKILNYDYSSYKTLNYILSLQNRDGGFRRSIHGGISTLEDTYYAVASLNVLTKKLDVLKQILQRS